MSADINRVKIVGNVVNVEKVKSGTTNNKDWTLHKIVVDDIVGAGRGAKDTGAVEIATLHGAPEKGQRIGVLCRVRGFEKKYNKDGESKTFYNHELTAVKKHIPLLAKEPEVVDDDDFGEPPVADKEKVSQKRSQDFEPEQNEDEIDW